MKTFKNIFPILLLLTGIFFVSCGEDDVAASIEELRNEGFDLAVITDSRPYVSIAFSVSGSGLKSVEATATPDGGTDVIATGKLSGITANSLSRVNINIPFPTNDVAPSGLYTINYKYVTDSGEKEGDSYMINVINNTEPRLCDYTTALSGGANVWIYIYTPTGAQLSEDDVLYATGSMEGWTGGDESSSDYAFTKIDDTCYELALNLNNGDEFKITRGDWPNEAQDYSRNNFSNYVYSGESSITFNIYDWADVDLDYTGIEPPAAAGLNIPDGAIQSGMLTVVVNVSGSDVNDGTYYIVEDGATSLDGAVEMIPFDGESKLAAAVAKNSDVDYIIVKDDISSEGTNAFGYAAFGIWDGMTNPVQFSVGSFEGGSYTVPDKFYMTGDATDGWAGGQEAFSIPSISPGIFEATLTINGDAEYLFLPGIGAWDDKLGRGDGDSSSGSISIGGPNLSTAGLASGSYKVTIDLTVGTGTYSLVAQ